MLQGTRPPSRHPLRQPRAARAVEGEHEYAVIHGAVCLHAAGLGALIRVPQDRGAAASYAVGAQAVGRLADRVGRHAPARSMTASCSLRRPMMSPRPRSRSRPLRWATCGATACCGCSQPARRCRRRSNRRPRHQTLHRSVLADET